MVVSCLCKYTSSNATATAALARGPTTGSGPSAPGPGSLWLFASCCAAQGDAQAQNHLGANYREGQAVAQDLTKARKCFELAAAQGYAQAQTFLGHMYQEGEGVARLRGACGFPLPGFSRVSLEFSCGFPLVFF